MMSDFDFGARPSQMQEAILEPEIAEESGLPMIQPFDTQPALSKLLEFTANVKKLLAEGKAIGMVQDDATNHLAISIASRMKTERLTIKAIHHYFTDPHFQYKKAVDNFFKQYEEPLEAEEKTLGRKSGSYRVLLDQERNRKEAAAKAEAKKLQDKLDAEAKAGEEAGQPFQAVTVLAPIIPETPKVIRTQEGAASLRKDWDFEVMEIDKVERRFLVVDGTAIRREIKGGLRESPGLRIFLRPTTNIRV